MQHAEFELNGLLLKGEIEVASAALDLVLGLQVVHSFCGDAVDGQHFVSNDNASFSSFPAIYQLQKHTKHKRLEFFCNPSQQPG